MIAVVPLEHALAAAVKSGSLDQCEAAVADAIGYDVDLELLTSVKRLLAEDHLRKVLYTEDDEELEVAIENAKEVSANPELVEEGQKLLDLE
jgi:hypothetical protein